MLTFWDGIILADQFFEKSEAFIPPPATRCVISV
jgi:hypothetical protein